MQYDTLIPGDSPWTETFTGIMPAVTKLYVTGNLTELLSRPRVAIVGSRKVSAYGREVTARFARELAGQGIVIVSGLALGVDAIAHRAALEAGGLTLAVLPSPLDAVYPSSHRGLAEKIVQGGGALVSEYDPGTPTYKWNFVGRNRIVSGISSVLLITEAAAGSGTMHTARFALEQGKDVCAVPGNITSLTSEGTNNLIKTGATPVTSPADVLDVLGFKAVPMPTKAAGSNHDEQLILDLLGAHVSDGTELLQKSGLAIDSFNHTITMLEITGKVRSLGTNRWAS